MGLAIPSNEFIYVIDKTCHLSSRVFPSRLWEFPVFV